MYYWFVAHVLLGVGIPRVMCTKLVDDRCNMCIYGQPAMTQLFFLHEQKNTIIVGSTSIKASQL